MYHTYCDLPVTTSADSVVKKAQNCKLELTAPLCTGLSESLTYFSVLTLIGQEPADCKTTPAIHKAGKQRWVGGSKVYAAEGLFSFASPSKHKGSWEY